MQRRWTVRAVALAIVTACAVAIWAAGTRTAAGAGARTAVIGTDDPGRGGPRATAPSAPLRGSAAPPPRGNAGPARVAAYTFTLLRQYARGTEAFTQGLVFHHASLFEGTGLYGESVLRETVLRDGVQRVLRLRPLPDGLELSAHQRQYQTAQLATRGYTRDQVQRFQANTKLFGEGIAIKGSRIYQLTWVEGVCLVWDLSNWNTPARTFHYSGEGWGLTHDGTHLIQSDGSATLAFRDPETFAVARRVQVKDPRTGAPVDQLNELEFIRGKVFANLYMTRRIAIIDPQTGTLEGLLYLDGAELGGARYPSLLPAAIWNQLDAAGDVLNGIAYDPARDRLFLTGKRWPAIFEVQMSKARDQ